MSLKSALQKANRYVNIIQYYNNNRHLLNKDAEYVKKQYEGFSDGYDVCFLSLDFDLERTNQIDINHKYIVFVPNEDLIVCPKRGDDIDITYDDVLDSSTEEKYFQLSTVYSTDILDAIVINDILNKNFDFDFYLDLDRLSELEENIISP